MKTRKAPVRRGKFPALNALRSFKQSHPVLFLVSVYFLLVAAVSAILFARFPNNILQANFYGEDGSVYLQNVIHKGWIHGSLTPFNGYSIVGIYGLCAIGWVLNALFGGPGILFLPVFFAAVAVAFMAAVIALPYLLFQKTFGSTKTLLAVLFGALMPLPQSPHIVIGTIGNQKWVFLYLAFLLVLYRLYNFRKLSVAKVIAIDAIILVSAYTNSNVYALVPVLYAPYLWEIWRGRFKVPLVKSLLARLRSVEFASLVAMSALLIPQVLLVLVRGIPKMPGYLDSPFQPIRAVELFINRTYLFGVTHILNGHMSDIAVLILFGALVYIGWKKLHGKEKVAFFLGLYAAGVASLLFTANRTGVTDFFFDYRPSGSGPDQFFYAQTLVMYLPIVLAVFGFAESLKDRRWRQLTPVIFVAFVVLSGLASNTIFGERWRNSSVFENYADSFIDQSLVACKNQTTPQVTVVVYPYPDGRFSLTAPRDLVCVKELQNYQSDVQHLGLQPNNNDFLAVDKQGKFYQTFRASENRLDGIRIFLSTFGSEKRKGEYRLEIYDQTCRQPLRHAGIPNILVDNSLYNARFKPIEGSANHIYCFTLIPPKGPSYDPVAVQQTAPNTYQDGALKIGDITSDKDLVFEPLYTQSKH